MDTAYLDNHSATRPFASVVDQVAIFHREYWGSVNAPHFVGQQAAHSLQKGIEQLFHAVGASSQDEMQLYGSGAEAVSQVFWRQYVEESRHTGKTQFLTTLVEEAPFLLSVKKLESLGCSGKVLPVDSWGRLTPDVLSKAIGPRTSLVSLSWANGLTGVMHPIEDLSEVCREKGCAFHVDASYVFARNFFRFQDLPIDFLTLNGSVLHAPVGSAVAFVKGGRSLYQAGQSDQNVAMTVALSQALEILQSRFEHYCTETARLRDKLEKGVCARYPEAYVMFQEAERVPHCTAIAFPGVAGEALLYLLNMKGVYASIGGGRFQALSKMLLGCGIEESVAHSAVSFCLSQETTELEIDYAVDAIVEAVHRLRSYSIHLERSS